MVARELERYAQRGVFQSFSRIAVDDRHAEFRFNWLWNKPFHIHFDRKRKTLAFKKLLRNIAPGSDLEAGLKSFIAGCCAPDRPEHRRLNTGRLAVQYANRAASVSLTFSVIESDYEYAVNKSINLVNEIFLNFLNVHHPEYMVENFQLPEE